VSSGAWSTEEVAQAVRESPPAASDTTYIGNRKKKLRSGSRSAYGRYVKPQREARDWAHFQSADEPERLGDATLVLREGRNHQVNRMFRALGATVVTLHRERFGSYLLPSDLLPGEFVEIDIAELGLDLDRPLGGNVVHC